ncbi:PqqD family protein, partial [Mediterraneibacter catenae]
MEKIKQEFVLRRIAGENVLIPVGNQGDKFQGIITLNETGRFIWEKLEEGKNLEEIAETITE